MEVAETLEAVVCESPSTAYGAAIEQHAEELDAFWRDLPCPPNTRGLVAGINGEFVALDLFDQPATLAKLCRRLIQGYGLDALARGGAVPADGFTATMAAAILERLGEIECRPCPSVGLGEEWAFETSDRVGSALVLEGVCVHMSAFPSAGGTQGSQPTDTARIARPSRRRRQQRR